MPSNPESMVPASSRRGWLKGLGALLTGGLLLSKSRAAAAPAADVFSTNGGQPVFLGEIMMISWGFAPRGFALCNGQLLPINQNQALFSLLGTQFGGNGQTNFALPDLRGRIPLHNNNSTYILGQRGGAEAHTLNQTQIPAHVHGLKASVDRGTTELAGVGGATPVHNYLADSGGGGPQYNGSPDAAMAVTGPSGVVNTTTSTGGSQAHNNLQPFTCINFVIAITGAVFPPQP